MTVIHRKAVPCWATRLASASCASCVAVALGLAAGGTAGCSGCGSVVAEAPRYGYDAGKDSGIETDGGDDGELGRDGATDGEVDGDDGGDAAIPDATVEVMDSDIDAGTCPPIGFPACGAALCGNGKIDDCTPDASPCEPEVCGRGSNAENCDGPDLGRATCKSLGFGGGTLACTSACTFDITGCSVCGDDPHIEACEDPPVPAQAVLALAVAATDTEVGLVWVTGASQPGEYPLGGLHIGVLGSTFGVVTETACVGLNDVGLVSIAATSSGWLVAAERQAGVALYPVSPSGTLMADAKILADAQAPILAANPAGGGLLVWVSASDGDGYVSLVGDDGTVTGASSAISQVVEPQYGSAAFAGDGYLVGLRGSLGATVVHVGLDGTVGAPSSLGSETEYPKVAWTGTEGRAVYADFSSQGTMFLTRLTATGAPVGPRLDLGHTGAYYGQSPVLTVGSDSVVLLAGYTSETGVSNHLDVTRIAHDNTTVYAPYHLTDPGSLQDFTSYGMAESGQSFVVAWVTTASPPSAVSPSTAIGVARITP
jgi:hypothetical protein